METDAPPPAARRSSLARARERGRRSCCDWREPGGVAGGELCLRSGFCGAGLKLQDNGYDGLLVAISPQVPENLDLITNIKANVIVTEQNGEHGDDPYTLQHRGCGDEGKHIHFTPNFLLNDELAAGYGSRGRVFVHEWAHLRWGVFDEYNNDKPFYINGQNEIQVTRCSSDITGVFVCEKGLCPHENCIISKLFREGCTFIYNSTQNATGSIMFMQSLSSVVEFCNSSTHNREAPNLQNRMCSLRSTWDIIADSDDISHSPPVHGAELPPPPTCSLLQAGDKVICLVIDVSRKMAEADRLLRLQQAAELYLMQVVEIHTFVGIVTFDSKGEIRAQLQQINSDNDRRLLVSYLPTTVSTEEETNTCAGVKRGFEVVEKKNGRADGSIMILVTSGTDEHINNCLPTVTSSGSTIHSIALGSSTVRKLEELSRLTGGLKFFIPDKSHCNRMTEAFSRISSGMGDMFQQSLQLESVCESVLPQHQLTNSVTVDRTVGNDTVFLVMWQTSGPPEIVLSDPSGRKYNTSDFVINLAFRTASLRVPGTAKHGHWTYTLNNTHHSPQALKVTVTSRASSLAISPATVEAFVERDSTHFPQPVIIYANVRMGLYPILNATVVATVEPEAGDPIMLHLLDNGADNIQMNAPKQIGQRGMKEQWGFSRVSSGGSFSVLGVPVGSHLDMFPPCKITDLEAVKFEEDVILSWTAPGKDYDQGQDKCDKEPLKVKRLKTYNKKPLIRRKLCLYLVHIYSSKDTSTTSPFQREIYTMGSLKSPVFILVLYLLEGVLSNSLIQLNNNGYEGIVIAIDHNVPEDEALIQQIKDMVTRASPYLFEATGKRFYFKNVAILIPENWKTKPDYERPKLETFKNADVLVSATSPVGNDQPYTEHVGACGEKGIRIHLTPDFLAGKRLDVYGPQERSFVHEWAHFRWGVFDEYNKEEKFYLSKGRVEAVRCSAAITGKNKVRRCQGGSCVNEGACRKDKLTGLYQENCVFLPDKQQSEKASIMYDQTIGSVVEFCTEKNHNKEAPNAQNKRCNLRSTWEVIQDSKDFQQSTPMTTQPPTPIFSLLQMGQRILSLVLDKSGSMSNDNRLNRMNQASKLFLLQTVEQGSWVGMVAFDSAAYIKSELKQINSAADRDLLTKTLPTVSSGRTSICSGLQAAFTMIKKKYPTDGSEIVLLTDGEDSTISTCFDLVKKSGAIIHTVALGPAAAKELEQLSKMTGGLQTYASDQAQNNGLVDAFAALSSGNGAVSQRSIQLESRGVNLQKNQWMNGSVVVDSTVGKDTLFLVTWTTQAPQILLWDPSGTKQGGFVVDTTAKMAYLQVPGIAKVGFWKYSLQASSQTLTLTVTSRAASATLPPITVTPVVNQNTGTFPNPVIVYATIRQGATPILRASVTALIESVNGKTETLELLDNGAGADATKNDGVYSRYFTAFDTNGRYSIKIWALGGVTAERQRTSPQKNTAKYIDGWIENGEIKFNPPQPETNNVQDKQLCFSRTSSGGSFTASNVPSAPIPDLLPPCRITDLKASIQGRNLVNLTWTAPGDDYDHGTASKYIIRISTSIADLRDKFNTSVQVNTTSLIPKEANSEEIFEFELEDNSFGNGTDIFIAIQAVDKSNLKSEISNIARVSLFIPTEEPPTSEDTVPPCPEVSVNSTIPGIHVLKIMWKWLGEMQVTLGLH
ncbi:calcium-activated chloride channel regulator 1 [Cricetulus griseus]|uniref:Calcium-activated chloride channel regulator 1 n=1 Tax=Cricetulus griseus TaxID=10029 RepID=A0A061ILY2_CRIGR|nr:calcium-activated chloride channel regulator 1 [Cricetulus griseus]